MGSFWTEFAKWGSWAGAAVGLFAVTVGWKFVKAHERRQWRNQKLTEKRIQVFDGTATELNDLFCYFERVGNWKELTPPGLVSAKRHLDKTMHINRYLFSEKFWLAYDSFIHGCFKTYTGSGKDAKLRIPARLKLPNWIPEWAECFCDDEEDFVSGGVLEARYTHLMKIFADEIGIH